MSFLTIVICHLKKQKRQTLKNKIFDRPLILNQTFSQTKFIIGKSDSAHITQFQ